ncbi:MAG: hypothetical protein D6713_10025 [Deltaproteobacteria bacterium]|nr:MAG: hypothetical protein D6713_10025 [Deltaproteobacteria bacterium]
MRKLLLAVLVLFLLFGMTAGVRAQESDRVSLDIQVVYASSGKKYVDPTLKSLSDKLKSLFNYSSFEIIERKDGAAGKGETRSFDLPGGREMFVTPVDIGKEKVRLKVRIRGKGEDLVKTTLSMERSAIVMVGGPEYREGVLIILISAD